MYKFLVLLLLLVVVMVAYSSIDTIPPDSMTATSMGETHVRIHMYMTVNRDYPIDLTVLPMRDGYTNRTTDGWGRPLIYSVDDQGIISLTSLGRDGTAGGDSDDADIVKRYRTRNENGSLNIDDEMWIVDSEI
jgi:hypothetical protein